MSDGRCFPRWGSCMLPAGHAGLHDAWAYEHEIVKALREAPVDWLATSPEQLAGEIAELLRNNGSDNES